MHSPYVSSLSITPPESYPYLKIKRRRRPSYLAHCGREPIYFLHRLYINAVDPSELGFMSTVMATHVWRCVWNYSWEFMLISKYRLPDMYMGLNHLASRLSFRVWKESFLLYEKMVSPPEE